MELILMVNLAFSIVGFFFIFRMWREVKERRDEYGENFNIPRAKKGKRGRRKPKRQAPASYEEYYDEYEDEDEEPEHGMSRDDVKALMLEIHKAQQEGA